MRIPRGDFAELGKTVDCTTIINPQSGFTTHLDPNPGIGSLFSRGEAMSLLQAAKGRRTDHDKRIRHRLSRIVTYPPPSTGTNFNLIDKVEHDTGDRVVWHIINSPDGRFIYNYDLIRANQKHIEKVCLDCRKLKVRGIKRLCETCARIRKRASNRKSQFKRRSVRKTDFWGLRAEALTSSIQTARYIEPCRNRFDALNL